MLQRSMFGIFTSLLTISLANRWSDYKSAILETTRNKDYTLLEQYNYKDHLYHNKFRYFSDDSTNSNGYNPEMSIDINGISIFLCGTFSCV